MADIDRVLNYHRIVANNSTNRLRGVSFRVCPFGHHWFDTAYGNVFVTDGANQPDRVFFGPSFEK